MPKLILQSVNVPFRKLYICLCQNCDVLELQEPDVLEIITRNKTPMETFSELVDQALLNLRNNLRDNDNEADSNVSDKITDILPEEDAAEGTMIFKDEHVLGPNYVSLTLMPNIELNELI